MTITVFNFALFFKNPVSSSIKSRDMCHAFLRCQKFHCNCSTTFSFLSKKAAVNLLSVGSNFTCDKGNKCVYHPCQICFCAILRVCHVVNIVSSTSPFQMRKTSHLLSHLGLIEGLYFFEDRMLVKAFLFKVY